MVHSDVAQAIVIKMAENSISDDLEFVIDVMLTKVNNESRIT
jgi:hypothetical protein